MATRRGVLQGMLALTLARVTVARAGEPKLAENDPQAKALGYVADAARVDAAKEPKFEKGSNCAGCALYLAAQEKDGYAPCSAFAGKRVSAAGWCRAFAGM